MVPRESKKSVNNISMIQYKNCGDQDAISSTSRASILCRPATFLHTYWLTLNCEKPKESYCVEFDSKDTVLDVQSSRI